MQNRYFTRTRAAFSKVGLSFRRAFSAFETDFAEHLHNFKNRIPAFSNHLPAPHFIEKSSVTGRSGRPIIFASACVDEQSGGGWKYNGGIKELNLLVRLCRMHGYEAYVVTWDGSYIPWMIEHEKHISLSEFRAIRDSGAAIRCVTSWAAAKAFIQEAPKLYFWDMELAYTEKAQFPVLRKLYDHKIVGSAAISRTIQAWHMAYFGVRPTVIPNLLDETIWRVTKSQGGPSTAGYMDEGPHTDAFVEFIAQRLRGEGLEIELRKIAGNEAEVLAHMSQCDFFLSLNQGKDPLWGEGCPRTILEALWAGCIPIAFDVVGNRETLIDGYNGIVLSDKSSHAMADALVSLARDTQAEDRLRQNIRSLLDQCHTFESRWKPVKEFLALPE